MTNLQNGEFAQMVAAITPPQTSTATIRVAVLHSGDGPDTGPNTGGMEVVYRHNLTENRLPDFADIPEFDLLLADMPDPVGRAPDMVLRFLRVRRPAFVILSRRALGRPFYDAAWGFGYETQGNVRNGVVIGTPDRRIVIENPRGFGALARRLVARLRRGG